MDYESFYRRRFRAAAESIGRPTLRFHDLRHTAASLWAASGMPLDVRTNFRFHISLFVVTRALGARIYSPLQLKELTENPLALDLEDIETIAHMLQEDAEFNANWQRWSVDRVVKSREFAESVIDRALGIDPDA